MKKKNQPSEIQPTLSIETTAVKEKQTAYTTTAQPTAQPTASTGKEDIVSIGNLSKIRARAKEKMQVVHQQKIIDDDNLRSAWNAYILKLKTEEKNSTAANFEMMGYHIITQDQIKVVCKGDMQFGFFKQEKNALLDHLKLSFHHKSLTLEHEYIETPKDESAAGSILSTKDQYQQLSERYPAVKALKERLGLDLDY